jgi:hypothetical protein
VDGKTFDAVNVPVLEGTKPVAARLGDGTPLRMATLSNGTPVLLVDTHVTRGPQEIEYILAPDNSSRPHAVGPVLDASTPPIHSKAIPAVIRPWEQYIPGIASMTEAERLAAEEQYIRDNFTYSLNPMDSDGPLKNTTLYTEAALEDEEANCNVANTLLAVGNPGLLNYVTGFHNNNTPEQEAANTMQLSTNEAHAWAVDRQGRIHDATPGGVSPEDAAHFKENSADFKTPQDQRKELIIKIAAGLGLLGLAGIGFAGRKRLAGRARNVKRNLAAIRVAAADPVESRLAYEVLNHALYSDKRLSRTNYRAAAERAHRTGAAATDEAWLRFIDSHPADAVNEAVARNTQRAEPSPEARKALQRAARLQRLYRTANGTV